MWKKGAAAAVVALATILPGCASVEPMTVVIRDRRTHEPVSGIPVKAYSKYVLDFTRPAPDEGVTDTAGRTSLEMSTRWPIRLETTDSEGQVYWLSLYHPRRRQPGTDWQVPYFIDTSPSFEVRVVAE